jgi:hypothetical protein
MNQKGNAVRLMSSSRLLAQIHSILFSDPLLILKTTIEVGRKGTRLFSDPLLILKTSTEDGRMTRLIHVNPKFSHIFIKSELLNISICQTRPFYNRHFQPTLSHYLLHKMWLLTCNSKAADAPALSMLKISEEG